MFFYYEKNTTINIEKFCNKLAKNQNLVKINYYIAPVGETKPKMYTEQQKFFEKLRKIPNLKIIFGRLEKRKRDGEIYYVEKATDVNLALDLVLNAQASEYDEAYLISNDGDFSGAAKATIQRFSKTINYVAIGTSRTISYHLKKVCSKMRRIDEKFIEDVKLK
jgi:uncharacterized LabA/DUF88 family protein